MNYTLNIVIIILNISANEILDKLSADLRTMILYRFLKADPMRLEQVIRTTLNVHSALQGANVVPIYISVYPKRLLLPMDPGNEEIRS